MQSNEECKIKFKQTIDLLSDLKSMPKLETSDNFLVKLHQRIELEQNPKINFFDKAVQYFSFSNTKSSISFAMSFVSLAIFTFIYLNNLNIFNQGIVNDNVQNSKSILEHVSIDIELARGIAEEEYATEDSNKDSLSEEDE